MSAPTELAVAGILKTPEQIAERIRELSARVDTDYAGRGLLLLGVLRGAVMVTADLARTLRHDHVEVDWVTLSSYGDDTTSSGTVRLVKEPDTDLTGRHVLVVDDITDSGLTMAWLLDELRSRGVASAEAFSLLRKPARTRWEVPIRYLGFEIDDEFVVGYGMDHAQRYRNLPYIARLAPRSAA